MYLDRLAIQLMIFGRRGIVSPVETMLQFRSLALRLIAWRPSGRETRFVRGLGRGAMVAQRTLNPYILVRIRAPQPNQSI